MCHCGIDLLQKIQPGKRAWRWMETVVQIYPRTITWTLVWLVEFLTGWANFWGLPLPVVERTFCAVAMSDRVYSHGCGRKVTPSCTGFSAYATRLIDWCWDDGEIIDNATISGLKTTREVTPKINLWWLNCESDIAKWNSVRGRSVCVSIWITPLWHYSLPSSCVVLLSTF